MAKFQSPLLGYNNNIRHQGRVFHIQTEDSGVNHPHIITHLFMDGGRILKSVKTSYAEHVGKDDQNEIVRSMMKEQHKAMIVALKDGQYDAMLDVRKKSTGSLDAAVSQRTPPTASPTASIPRRDSPAVVSVKVSTEKLAPKRVEPPAPLSTALPLHDPPLPPELEALLRDELPPPPAAPAPAPTEPKRPPSVRELTLDFDALERDAGEGSVFQRQDDLPPPPAALFAKEPRTAPYRAVDEGHSRVPPNRVDVSPSRVPPPTSTRTPTKRPRPASIAPPSAASSDPRSTDPRSGPFRPAPTYAAPKPPPASLFSDELVSDKSLDEVILSYLAEDLEAARRK